MKYLAKKKVILIGLSAVFLLGLAMAFLNAGSYLKEKQGYFEVSSGKIAYVPRTARFVKVDGKIKRIVRFATTLNAAEKDCECPHCCQGNCYIIVFSDSALIAGPIMPLFVLWVACT